MLADSHGPYGHFSDDGSEFIVTDPATPRACDNFPWNEAIFADVQQTGLGYADHQAGDGEAVQPLTGIGRVCDFEVSGRDGLMSRLVTASAASPALNRASARTARSTGRERRVVTTVVAQAAA